MNDRILALLSQCNILRDKKDLSPITEGASGAYVFSLQEEYIIKYVYFPELEPSVVKRCKNEFNFYKHFSNKNIDYIPEVEFQIANEDELLIVLKKYSAVKQYEWNDSMQMRCMMICASINALNTDEFSEVFAVNDEQYDDVYPLSVSYKNWVLLHNKFPNFISISVLNEMYEHFNEIDQYAKQLTIPKTLCHGDFHPHNCLLYGNQLLICDWQNVNIGRGIGDVAFFISRGKDMGLSINEEKLIEKYYESLIQSIKTQIDVNTLQKFVGAAEFIVSFRFWAEYLQSSDLDRILSIYNNMIKNFNIVRLL